MYVVMLSKRKAVMPFNTNLSAKRTAESLKHAYRVLGLRGSQVNRPPLQQKGASKQQGEQPQMDNLIGLVL